MHCCSFFCLTGQSGPSACGHVANNNNNNNNIYIYTRMLVVGIVHYLNTTIESVNGIICQPLSHVLYISVCLSTCVHRNGD